MSDINSDKQNSGKKPGKKLIERWQSWVAIISATIVLFGALLDLPQKISDAFKNISPDDPSCEFYGRIVYSNDQPVVNAEIIVEGEKGSGFTDDNGEFHFTVKEKAGTRVQMLIKKDGLIKNNTLETLPGPVTIQLKDNL